MCPTSKSVDRDYLEGTDRLTSMSNTQSKIYIANPNSSSSLSLVPANLQTSRKRNRRRRRAKNKQTVNAVTSQEMVLVPASNAKKVQTYRPRISRSQLSFQPRQDYSGTQVLHFDQIIGEFTPKLGDSLITEFRDVFILSPGFWNNRVGVIARSYGNYRFEKLHVVFNSVASSLLSGSVSFGVQNFGNITFDTSQIVGTNGGMNLKISESGDSEIDLSAFNSVKAYPMAFDPTLQLGLVVAGDVSSDGTGVSHMPSTLGYFRIYGTVRLMNPGIISKRYITKKSTLLTEATDYKRSVDSGMVVTGTVQPTLVAAMQELTVDNAYSNPIGSFFYKLLKKGAVILKEVGENAVKFLINRVATEFTASNLGRLRTLRNEDEDVDVRVYGTLPDEEQPGVVTTPNYSFTGEFRLVEPATTPKPQGLVIVVENTAKIGYATDASLFPGFYVIEMGDNFSLTGSWTLINQAPNQYLLPANREEAVEMFIKMGIPALFFYPESSRYRVVAPNKTFVTNKATLIYPQDRTDVPAPSISGPFTVAVNGAKMSAEPDYADEFKQTMIANGVVDDDFFSSSSTSARSMVRPDIKFQIGPFDQVQAFDFPVPSHSFLYYWKVDEPFEVSKYIYYDSTPSEVIPSEKFFSVYEAICMLYGMSSRCAGTIYWALIHDLLVDHMDNPGHHYQTKFLGLVNHILKVVKPNAPSVFIQSILDEGEATDYEMDFSADQIPSLLPYSTGFISRAAISPDLAIQSIKPGIMSLLPLSDMVSKYDAQDCERTVAPWKFRKLS